MKNRPNRIYELVKSHGANSLAELLLTCVETHWTDPDDNAECYELYSGKVVVIYKDGTIEIE